MKEKFPGFSKKSEEEIKQIWDYGLITFDTNVLLNLYRYSRETQETILNLISKFKDKIFITHQVALEYNRNRYEVITEQEKSHKSFLEKLQQIENDLNSKNKAPFLSEELHQSLSDVFKKVEGEVDNSILFFQNMLKDDKIFDEVSNIFQNKITKNYSTEELTEIYKLGKVRYEKSIPPGYEDNKKHGEKKYGDLIVWKQILDKSKKRK